jgi:hypothetical protein
VHQKMPAGFGGRLRGKGRSSQHVNPDLAAQPTLSLLVRLLGNLTRRHLRMSYRLDGLEVAFAFRRPRVIQHSANQWLLSPLSSNFGVH